MLEQITVVNVTRILKMIRKNKNKPTIKQLATMIGTLIIQLEQLRDQVFNGDKALDQYIEYKGDKEDFIKFLQKKFAIDDKDNKKTEDK